VYGEAIGRGMRFDIVDGIDQKRIERKVEFIEVSCGYYPGALNGKAYLRMIFIDRYRMALFSQEIAGIAAYGPATDDDDIHA